jgi:hypothetical protein
MAIGNTFNAMVAQIAFELGNRTDLSATVIPRAINDAIEIYQKERFRFNELQPLSPFTFNTVQGRRSMALRRCANSQALQDRLSEFPARRDHEPMDRVTPEEIYLALDDQSQAGPPSSWAWDGDTIIIYPRAAAEVYPITVGGYMQVDGPAVAAYGTTRQIRG